MNQDERLITLLEKYLDGSCSPGEKEEVEQWYEQVSDPNRIYYSGDLVKIRQAADASFNKIKPKLRIDEGISVQEGKIRRFSSWYVAAAVLLLMLSAGLYFFRAWEVRQIDSMQVKSNKIKHKIVPGTTRAILTLADGSEIILNDVKEGQVAEQGGVRISKTSDGQLVYSVLSNHTSGEQRSSLSFNTITTPKGGQYQVILPDGSHVWLNAASSLRYPTVFSERERQVYLTGEGYFEIAKQEDTKGRRVPFIVETFSQKVEVLGTQFNINDYRDEQATVTTLLEGSVKVSAGSSSKLIEPGQATELRNGTLQLAVGDPEAALAWKNGFFSFKNSDIKTVMRQLARWYNLEVEYQGAVPSKQFSGEIYRNANIQQVFDLLDYYKVHYRLEAGKIVIIP